MKKLRVSLIAAAATALLSTAGFAEDIKVGIAGPMTGDLASFGEQLQKGASQAFADINEKGGVLGKKLVVEIGDDVCDPKQAVAVANDMASKGVVFVVGHFCSGSSIPASKVYGEEGILQITSSSTNPGLTEEAAKEGLTNIFRTCGRDDQQGAVAGKYLAENYKDKNIAVLHDKTPYGKGLADETKKNLNAAGVTEKLYEAYTAGEQDYSALVSKLKENNIDVIYLGGYHPEAGLIIRQAREQGLKAQLVSGDAMADKEFWTIAGDAGEGTIFTYAAEARDLPSAKPAVEKFRAQGFEPEGYTLSSYAAVQVWAMAAEKAGTTDPVKVAEALRSGSWDTVIGKVAFDAKGDLTEANYVWYQFSKGTYAELKK